MIEDLPPPERIALDACHCALPPCDCGADAIRADRAAISKMLDQMASALEAVIADPKSGEMLNSRGAVTTLRGLIAILAPKG